MLDEIVGLELSALVDSIRKRAGSSAWKRGEHIAKSPKVALESVDEDEIEMRVPRDRGILNWAVSLYPNDDEWCCDCPIPRDTCEHVCAAVIVASALANGDSIDRHHGDNIGRIHYRFSRDGRTLRLKRLLERGGQMTELSAPLGTLAKDEAFVASVLVHDYDLDLEHVLNKGSSHRIGRERLPELFKSLRRSTAISLDGQAIQVRTEKTRPALVVERLDGGFVIRLRPDDELDEVFENGIARVGDILRPIGTGGLSAAETRLYSRGRYYPEAEVSRLMAHDLPELQERALVTWQGDGPPELESMPPRIDVTTHREGNELVVLAHLVYGEEPIARVVNDQLELLGDKVPLRDVEDEERLTEELRVELGLKPGIPARLRDREALNFAAQLKNFAELADDDITRRFHEAPAILPELDTTGGQFHLEFRSGSRAVAANAVMDSWTNGDSLVPLQDGGFAPLPLEWLQRCGQLVADLLEAKELNGALPKASLPDLGRLCESLDIEIPEIVQELRSFVADFSHIPRAPKPADLQATLRSYQEDAVDWLAFLKGRGFGALLADDMGLGKTLQALTIVDGRTLVVAPTSVIRNWENESARFRPTLRVATFHGPKRVLDPEASITLTTYAVLRIDQELLATQAWDMVVLDEAQAIKNPTSQVAQAAFKLNATFRLALTGTPVENRLEELWSQFHFLNPGLLGTRKGFQNRYAKPMEKGNEAVGATLRTRLKPFMLRRLKSEVAPELPPRTDMVLHVTLSDEERGVYNALRLTTQNEIREHLARGGGVIQALEALLRLRQAACHRGLLPGQNAAESSKVTLLGEALEKAIAEGHKALVFSQWTSLLDRIERDLDRRGFDLLRLDGSTRNRGDIVDKFQSIDGPPVLLLSLKAGGTGLNLTAADHVFIVDPWWNPATEEQAADRAHRIGQDRPVMVHRLIATDTVEEKILALQTKKRMLAEQALSGSRHGGALKKEDLFALLQD
jgi:superfamily II DNA or RNA helicase